MDLKPPGVLETTLSTTQPQRKTPQLPFSESNVCSQRLSQQPRDLHTHYLPAASSAASSSNFGKWRFCNTCMCTSPASSLVCVFCQTEQPITTTSSRASLSGSSHFIGVASSAAVSSDLYKLTLGTPAASNDSSNCPFTFDAISAALRSSDVLFPKKIPSGALSLPSEDSFRSKPAAFSTSDFSLTSQVSFNPFNLSRGWGNFRIRRKRRIRRQNGVTLSKTSTVGSSSSFGGNSIRGVAHPKLLPLPLPPPPPPPTNTSGDVSNPFNMQQPSNCPKAIICRSRIQARRRLQQK